MLSRFERRMSLKPAQGHVMELMLGDPKRQLNARFWSTATMCIGLSFLTNCASPVATADIKAFGAAATAVSSTLDKARSADRELAAKLKTELEAGRYVGHNPSYSYPPGTLQTKSLAAAVWAPRVQFLKALAGYCQALANLEDPQNGARAEQGIADLQAAVLSFKPAGPDASLIAPVGGAVQALVG